MTRSQSRAMPDRAGRVRATRRRRVLAAVIAAVAGWYAFGVVFAQPPVAGGDATSISGVAVCATSPGEGEALVFSSGEYCPDAVAGGSPACLSCGAGSHALEVSSVTGFSDMVTLASSGTPTNISIELAPKGSGFAAVGGFAVYPPAATPPVACSAGIVGSVFYWTALGRYCYCGGTGTPTWRGMSDDAACVGE